MSKKNKIMFVDDSKVVLTKLKEYMSEHEGEFDCHYFDDPKDAADNLTKEKWDIVVSDLLMPEITGVELFSFIIENNIQVPFLLITSASPEDKELISVSDILLNPQFKGIISKPFSSDTLLKELRDVLSGGKTASFISTDDLIREMDRLFNGKND